MEQTMQRYRCESPYRTAHRKEEITQKATKFWVKFIRQAFISAIIMTVLLCCKKVDAITNSTVWVNGSKIVQEDITVEEMKDKIEWCVEYAKITVPEILNFKKPVAGETKETELPKVEETIPVAEEKAPAISFENMTQEEIDRYTILSSTTVERPVGGEVTSRFGSRRDPITQVASTHTGIDYLASIGTQVKSAISGTVIEVSDGGTTYGKYIKVQNSDIITLYAHCSELKVKKGDIVKQGDIIALTGNTGKTSGPHLHFEVTKAGRLINPEELTSE